MPRPEDFAELTQRAERALEDVGSVSELEKWRIGFLGRNGELTKLLTDLPNVAAAERPAAGKAGNEAKRRLERLLQDKQATLGGSARADSHFDVTMPGRVPAYGHAHPISLVLAEITEIFTGLGFSVAEGPEVEDDWHNFEALNIGADHPARDMQDTFYVEGAKTAEGNYRFLPRTHTSGVQLRAMRSQSLPIRIIAPGRVYRNETEDATHSAVFHQVEGLMVDESTTFADMKGILTVMVRRLLGEETKLRFRPSFFPYTEPSAEIDVSSPGVRGGQWLELLGAGMVHPDVIRNAGHDPARYRGFAFGLGLERVAMLKYGIEDLRLFMRPDIRLLEQF